MVFLLVVFSKENNYVYCCSHLLLFCIILARKCLHIRNCLKLRHSSHFDMHHRCFIQRARFSKIHFFFLDKFCSLKKCVKTFDHFFLDPETLLESINFLVIWKYLPLIPLTPYHFPPFSGRLKPCGWIPIDWAPASTSSSMQIIHRGPCMRAGVIHNSFHIESLKKHDQSHPLEERGKLHK